MPSAAPGKPYLTPNQTAALLMVAPATLRVWADKGLLKAHTTAGGHRRFMREDIERFRLERQQNGGEPREAGQRILIVDDETAITRYLSALLEGCDGARTAIANDGFTAGHLVHAFRPDVVLLDLMMPGLDGFQVCRQIKSDAATRHIRVIAMTGFPTPENHQRIIAAGALHCLDKPLEEASLLGLLDLSERGQSA
jgi:excisionase family DNA binding protein